jgi:RNA polymerase sigma-70 factor, ECF subfamily
MRRILVLGNELPAFPVILDVTPIFALDTACSWRRPRNAVISRGQYLKPGADLYMNDEVGGNQRRARFEALCRSLRPDLLRFAFWLSRDRAMAEDVVQESMLRAWNARDSLLNEAAAKPWLLTIVRREFARLFERKRFATVDIDELVAREEPTLAAADEQDIGEMRAALFRLPDEYREPLALQVLMGYSTAEIARELNLSSAAVLTRLFRARRQLRAACGENTAEDPRE